MKMYLSILFISFLLIGGCSDEEDKTIPMQSSNELIFKDQIQALEKAKEVEKMLQIGADIRGQAIDEQSR
jgi:uncharacterized protein YcfL